VCAIHFAHSATADELSYLEHTKPRAGEIPAVVGYERGWRTGDQIEEATGIYRLVKKSLDFTTQIVVACAGFGEKRRAVATGALGRRLIEVLDLLPANGIHW
jgi:hypothetical protein